MISNHPDLEREARAAGVPFHHVPVERGARRRPRQRMLELLRRQRATSWCWPATCRSSAATSWRGWGCRRSTSTTPSCRPSPGAEPYRRAREHGVKLIGATAHYVTEELDAGPIIEQGVERVDHRLSVGELERVGRDIERLVLARAVALHLDDRVIVDGRRTVVF